LLIREAKVRDMLPNGYRVKKAKLTYTDNFPFISLAVTYLIIDVFLTYEIQGIIPRL